MAEVEAVRAFFRFYLAGDQAGAEPLVADDFVFTSPVDDHIDRAAFFERCFPTADRLLSQEIVHAVPAGGGRVFVCYEYELRAGGRFRNTELITVRDGVLTEAQVYFGGSFDHR
jgi:ketosteroid isomerase-like protein